MLLLKQWSLDLSLFVGCFLIWSCSFIFISFFLGVKTFHPDFALHIGRRHCQIHWHCNWAGTLPSRRSFGIFVWYLWSPGLCSAALELQSVIQDASVGVGTLAIWQVTWSHSCGRMGFLMTFPPQPHAQSLVSQHITISVFLFTANRGKRRHFSSSWSYLHSFLAFQMNSASPQSTLKICSKIFSCHSKSDVFFLFLPQRVFQV